MQYLLIFISLLLAVLATTFAFQNATPVTVTFLTSQFQVSLALLVIIALVSGMLMSLAAALPRLIRDALTIRTQKKKLAEIEASLRENRLQLESARKISPAEKPATTEAPSGTVGSKS